jgi:hypothetical protein
LSPKTRLSSPVSGRGRHFVLQICLLYRLRSQSRRRSSGRRPGPRLRLLGFLLGRGRGRRVRTPIFAPRPSEITRLFARDPRGIFPYKAKCPDFCTCRGSSLLILRSRLEPRSAAPARLAIAGQRIMIDKPERRRFPPAVDGRGDRPQARASVV